MKIIQTKILAASGLGARLSSLRSAFEETGHLLVLRATVTVVGKGSEFYHVSETEFL